MKSLIYISDGTYNTVESVIRNYFQISKTMLKRLKHIDNAILLNGKPSHSNIKINYGDCICVNIQDSNLSNNEICFDILYEDEYIIAINKPAGIAVHSNPYSRNKTVENYFSNGEFHPINRLDKGTSGVMLIAKDGRIHNLMQKIIHSNYFLKQYIAIADGIVFPKSCTIIAPIERRDSGIKRIISSNGKYAKTHYETILCENNRTLLLVTPETGRTHQIRIHMSHIGFPLTGDFLYGNESPLIKRTALHAYSVEFEHPISKSIIKVVAPIPDDIKSLFSKIDFLNDK